VHAAARRFEGCNAPEEMNLFCAEDGAELLVLYNEQLSPEQEMVQDLLPIVHRFSARLYGLPNYRKNLSEALAEGVAQ
jgi:putative resolvase